MTDRKRTESDAGRDLAVVLVFLLALLLVVAPLLTVVLERHLGR